MGSGRDAARTMRWMRSACLEEILTLVSSVACVNICRGGFRTRPVTGKGVLTSLPTHIILFFMAFCSQMIALNGS